MKVTATITGLKQLETLLRTQLPRGVQGKALRAAVTAGARLVANEAKQNVPVDTGLVKERIRVMSKRNRQPDARFEIDVGVRADKKRRGKESREKVKGKGATVDYINDPFYWKFIEFGTRKKAARPFLRPALENKREEATRLIAERLRARIEVEVAKLKGR